MHNSSPRQKRIGPMVLCLVAAISSCSEPSMEEVSDATESPALESVVDLSPANEVQAVSYTHLRAHETPEQSRSRREG